MTKLIIEGSLPGLNEYTNACRGSWASGASMKKVSQSIVSTYIAKYLKGVKFERPVRLTFRWYEKNQMRDLDNVAFAKKFILDALVQRGVLIDDGWRYVKGYRDEFYVDKKRPRIEVEFEELESGQKES